MAGTHGPPSRRRLPALDGLRGLAILLVLVVHSPTWEPSSPARVAGRFLQSGGWVGVDVFFALSGYLITGILWDARGSPRYYRDFYARRAQRIWPLYYLLLIVVLLVLPALLGGPVLGVALTPGEQACYWLGMPNWLAVTAAGPAFPGGDLVVAWSLAVEEQFYLVWPAAIAILARRAAVRVAAAVAVGSFLLRVAASAAGLPANAAYVLTPCKLDALALGVIVALVQRGPGGVGAVGRFARRALPAGAVVAAGSTAYAWACGTTLLVGDSPAHVTLSAGVGLMSAGVIGLCLASPAGAVARLFLAAPLRWLGRYSYGIYLLHLPAFRLACWVLGDGRLPAWAVFLAYAVSGPAAGWLSWHLLEKRVLALRVRPADPPPVVRPQPGRSIERECRDVEFPSRPRVKRPTA